MSGHDCLDMRELSGDGLLARPVRLHGIDLGRPVDLLLDREALRAVGLDVLCGDGVHRFLPLPTAAIGDEALTVAVVLETGKRVAFDEALRFAPRRRTAA